MLKFKATAIAALEVPDLNAFSVILAEGSEGGGMRLEVQKSLSFDEQDKNLGQDTYCLCTERGAACYGGVASWRLTDNSLEIILDTKAAEMLGVEDGFVVELEISQEIRNNLRKGLQRVLE